MKKYNFIKTDGRRPSQEQQLDTQLFYQNAPEIYARFEEWKDIDRFYFIPLYMEMTYSCGWVAEIAPDPVWLGSFVRCTLEHPELFQYKCPKCGKTVFPYRYVGSPLSGVVHLEGRCDCGWKGFDGIIGWRTRANALRDTICEGNARWNRFRLFKRGKPSSIAELLEWLQ